MHIKVGVNKKANVSSYTNSVSHENIKVKKDGICIETNQSRNAIKCMLNYLFNIQ